MGNKTIIRALDVLGEGSWRRVVAVKRWERLVARLEEGLLRVPTIREAACLVRLCPTRFRAVFQRLAGMTWGRFKRRWRMLAALRAAEARPEAKLWTIARESGYATEKELSRAFAEYWRTTVRGRATSANPRSRHLISGQGRQQGVAAQPERGLSPRDASSGTLANGFPVTLANGSAIDTPACRGRKPADLGSLPRRRERGGT